MTDNTPEHTPPPSAEGRNRAEAPLRSMRNTLTRRDANGRPMAVYGIVGIGVATLLILMLVVYLATGDRGKDNQPICTTITTDHAQSDIRAGKVERFTVVYAEDEQTPTDNAWGPVQARLDYADGTCGTLPQGVTNQSGLMVVLGAIDFYNQVTDGARVKVSYSAQTNLDESLFAPPTQAPTAVSTEAPTATAEPTSPPATPTTIPASPRAITTEQPTATHTPDATPTP